ncbi:uncharacterized protein KY384_001730 [Bacidia gigantensis]|uniref:uncharacterized protein n=1 Tax=Bacidia gigantensis TaxID=2732470 RepID=UPI001D03A214|nr:uncharacterized protein KY384_001730 [Bacidia gigantensis]KAG8533987.1 hypothetical protein KY384_001730 [Bacidia gigantensis]
MMEKGDVLAPTVGDEKSYDIAEERGAVAVSVKYMGTDADRHDMEILGRKQVLRASPRLRVDSIIGCLSTHRPGVRNISATLQVDYQAPWAIEDEAHITPGWVIAVGWQGSVIGLSFSAGTIIQALIELNNSNYVPQQWHGTLLVIAAVSFAIVFNIATAKHLPIIQVVLLMLHVAAEEIKDASSNLPKAILWSVILNILLGYLTVFTLCFTIRDPAALLENGGTFPFVSHLFTITKSKTGTNVMVAIIIITLVCAVIAEIATASRQIWAFSRDNGFPFSAFLSKVGSHIPNTSITARIIDHRPSLRNGGFLLFGGKADPVTRSTPPTRSPSMPSSSPSSSAS